MSSSNSMRLLMKEQKEPEPVKLENFARDAESMIASKEARYDVLGSLSTVAEQMPMTQYIGKLNIKDNKYQDTVPHDQTRMVLKQPIDGSDYINASRITGDTWDTKFIAAQAPTAGTVQRFLQMLLQEEIELVVMLTKCLEANQHGGESRKCEQYWPAAVNSTIEIGAFKVTLQSESVCGGFVRRVLVLEQPRLQQQQQKVTQLQFTEWPMRWMLEPKKFAPFFDEVHGAAKKAEKPVLVHCSVGVGRTAVLIALHWLIQRVEAGAKQMSIFTTLMQLQRCRPQMLRSEKQLRFLYAFLLHYFETHGNLPTVCSLSQAE